MPTHQSDLNVNAGAAYANAMHAKHEGEREQTRARKEQEALDAARKQAPFDLTRIDEGQPMRLPERAPFPSTVWDSAKELELRLRNLVVKLNDEFWPTVIDTESLPAPPASQRTHARSRLLPHQLECVRLCRFIRMRLIQLGEVQKAQARAEAEWHAEQDREEAEALDIKLREQFAEEREAAREVEYREWLTKRAQPPA